MFELLIAAKLLLLAPATAVGTDRTKIEARFGQPVSIGTDMLGTRRADGTTDRVVTLDWADLRVRLYEAPDPRRVVLIGVTATKDIPGIGSAVGIGSDRGTVLRELGGPAYEDEQQIVYSLQQENAALPNDTLRLVLRDDRVVGLDWTFPLEQ